MTVNSSGHENMEINSVNKRSKPSRLDQFGAEMPDDIEAALYENDQTDQISEAIQSAYNENEPSDKHHQNDYANETDEP